MKGTSPFNAILVTPDEAHRYERQAQQLLGDALRGYDAHVAACKNGKDPLQDKWQWKPLKTHEKLKVFKERQPTHPEPNPGAGRTSKSSTGSAASRSTVSDKASKTTKAVAMAAYTPEMALSMSSSAVTMSVPFASAALTGHIDGALSDVMYGLLATDTSELELRSRYMADSELVDSVMLTAIQSPTEAEPFQFLGLQWVVRGESSRSKSSAKGPRDFVVLIASGVVRHKVSGSKEPQDVGYYMCHSVDLQECEEVKGLTRGWMSTCSLFTPAKENAAHVDVFSRAFVDFKGKMPDYQAANMTSTLLLAGVTEAASCGQNKKLSWLLNFKGAAAEFRRMQPESTTKSNRCGICDRKFGVLHSVASCNLCQAKMCSRCRVSRDVSFVKRRDTALSVTQSRSWDEGFQSAQVRTMTTVLCKNCVMSSGHLDARVMARREIAAVGLTGFEHTVNSSDNETPIPQGRMSMSYSSQSGSEYSFDASSSSASSRMRFWTPGTDTAALRGRRDNSDQQTNLVSKPYASARDDDGKSSQGSKFQSSFRSSASTVPSPRDQESEQSVEMTPYQPRHQPKYIAEEPDIPYTYNPQHAANLVRRMEELNMAAESVYQFTSKMNARTRLRHQQSSSSSIQELD